MTPFAKKTCKRPPDHSSSVKSAFEELNEKTVSQSLANNIFLLFLSPHYFSGHHCSTRRRNVPEARALPSTASPALKLLQAVPNLVALGAREKVNRAPSVDLPAASSFPGAVLYCYRPPPPTPPEEGKANRVAQKEYKEVRYLR